MKNFLTIILALVVTMSASAVPFKGERMNEVLKSANKAQRVEALRHKKAQSAQPARFVRPNQQKQLKAPRVIADGEPVQTTISSFNSTYYPEDSAVWYSLYTPSWEQTFYFSIYTEPGKRDVEWGRTYTLSDMEQGSVNHWEDDDWNEFVYTEASFVKTIGENYDIHIQASVTDVNGNSYVLNYDEQPLVITGETITIAFTEERPSIEYISDGSWLYRAGGEDYDYSVQLSVYSDDMISCQGTYAGDELDYSSTSIAVFGEEDDWGDREVSFLNVKHGEVEMLDTDTAIVVTGDLLAEDGNVYHLNLISKKPVAERTVEISANNLSINDYWFDFTGEVTFIASDSVNEVELTLYPQALAEGMDGEYTIGQQGARADVRTVDVMDDVQTSAFSGSLTLTYNQGSVNISGSILCYDNVLYLLDLNYIKPEKSREQQLDFANLILTVFSDDSWQVMGYNNNQDAYISLAGVPADFGPVSGTYTEADLVMDYSYVITDITANSYNRYSILSADLNVDFNAADGTANISGTMLCINSTDATDVPLFTINIQAFIPSPYMYDEAESDFTYNIADYTLSTEASEFGALYVDAMEDGYMVGLQFIVAEGTTELAPGTYPINATQEENTVLASPGLAPTGMLLYSFAAIVNVEERIINNAWFLVDGTVEVKENGVIEVQAVNTNGKSVNVRLGDTDDAVENIHAGKARSSKLIRNGQLLIVNDGNTYNLLGTIVD